MEIKISTLGVWKLFSPTVAINDKNNFSNINMGSGMDFKPQLLPCRLYNTVVITVALQNLKIQNKPFYAK